MISPGSLLFATMRATSSTGLVVGCRPETAGLPTSKMSGLAAVLDKVMCGTRQPAIQNRLVTMLIVGQAQHEMLLEPNRQALAAELADDREYFERSPIDCPAGH